MFTIDANIFVRDIDTADPEHSSCHALLDLLQQRRLPIICPQIVLPEVAGAVSRTWQDPMRGRLAAQLLGELPNLTLLAVDAVLAQQTAEFAADLALRGMDAIYVVVAYRQNCTLISLDGEVRQRAGSRISVLKPVEALAQLVSGKS